jgi:N-methylhydantoinase A
LGEEGGASILVPLIANNLSFEYKKADYADVISSIDVATGMIYEEKEKTINNPTPEDVTQLVTEKDLAIRKMHLLIRYPFNLNI